MNMFLIEKANEVFLKGGYRHDPSRLAAWHWIPNWDELRWTHAVTANNTRRARAGLDNSTRQIRSHYKDFCIIK